MSSCSVNAVSFVFEPYGLDASINDTQEVSYLHGQNVPKMALFDEA